MTEMRWSHQQELTEHGRLRHGAAMFPAPDGSVLDAEARGKLFLGKTEMLSQLYNSFSKLNQLFGIRRCQLFSKSHRDSLRRHYTDAIFRCKDEAEHLVLDLPVNRYVGIVAGNNSPSL